jgi:hypothetical protein
VLYPLAPHKLPHWPAAVHGYLLLGLVRLSISQALAGGALDDAAGAFRILDAESGACVPAERELVNIAAKMLLADAVKATPYAALQGREETLDRLSVRLTVL